MEVSLTSDAQSDLQDFGEERRRRIKQDLEDLSDGIHSDKLKIIPSPKLDRPVWQMKAGKENKARAFIDLKEARAVVVAVWDFEYTHSGDQHWNELDSRI